IASNAQAQVVDQPTIDQMDMRTSRPIHVGVRFRKADAARACGLVVFRGNSRQRYGTTSAGVVLEGDRVEERGKCGRRSDGVSDRYAAHVQAQQVELRLRK